MVHTLRQLLSNRYAFLYASVAFTVFLLAVRATLTHNIFGAFLVWNLFLAGLPLFFALWLQRSRQQGASPLGQMLLFTAWLLFFPNAMYIVTDLFHLKTRYPVPLWFDTIVLFSAAWNGVILGFKSLSVIQRLLGEMFNKTIGCFAAAGFLFLAGYGIFLGRYLRWNSWDVLGNPLHLAGDIAHHLLRPHHHLLMYGFVALFGGFMCLAYFGLQQYRAALAKNN